MARVEIGETVTTQGSDGHLIPVSGASVQVNIRGAGAATVYSAESGGGTLANPLTTNNGRIEGWLEEGSYDLVISGGATSVGAITTYTQRFEAVTGQGVATAATDAELAAHAAEASHVNARVPTGAAGGVLGGTYPNPAFAADMTTQAELDTHAALKTGTHGIPDVPVGRVLRRTATGWEPAVAARTARIRRVRVDNAFINPRAANNLTGWESHASDVGDVLTRRADDGHTGATSVQLEWNSVRTLGRILVGSPLASQAFACAPGQVVWARASVKNVLSVTAFELLFMYYTSADVFISSEAAMGLDAPGAGWNVIEGFGTAPATAAKVQIYLHAYAPASSAATARATDAQVIVDPLHSVPGGYHAGDRAPGAWLGTAHASRTLSYAKVPTTDNLLVGMNDNSLHNAALTATETVALAAELGLTSYRFGVQIKRIQPTSGAAYDFSFYDELIRELYAAGINPMLSFGLGPAWMTPSVTEATFNAGAYPPDVAFYDEYAAACAAAASRWGHAVAAEIWNEPNLGYGFWNPAPNAVNYTNLLSQCYDAIKAAVPAMPVLGGSLAGTVADGATFSSLVTFLGAMLDNGAAAKMDALAIHSYPFGASSASRATGATEWRTGWGRTLRDTRQLLRARSVTKPLWITEVGLTSTGTDPVITERQQAQALLLLKGYCERDPDIAGLYFHTLLREPNDATTGRGYEILEGPSWRRKPAFERLRSELAPTSEDVHAVDVEKRIIGSPGEEVTFTTGVVNFGQGYSPARYSKNAHGWVVVEGLIDKTTNWAAGNLVLSVPLPPGYRPAGKKLFITGSGDAFAAGRVDVGADGHLVVNVAANTYLSLEGIGFYAD